MTSMNKVNYGIYLQLQVTPDEIRKLIRSLPFMTEVTQMMDVLKSQSSEIIIISDANSVFISELLDAANLTSYITKVFTNPAYFDDVRAISKLSQN